MQTLIIAVTGNEEKLGKKVQKLVREKKYDEVIKALNKIKVPAGHQLSIHLYEETGEYRLGDECYLEIHTPNGLTFHDNQKEFWRLLNVENSPEGAWQIYLLYNLWHYLPMFWHALYEKRTYVYSTEQLKKASRYFPDFGDEPVQNFKPEKYDIYPVIWQEGDIWHVGANYWTDFGGLMYEELKINLDGKVHVYSRPVSRKTLFRYECGICF